MYLYNGKILFTTKLIINIFLFKFIKYNAIKCLIQENIFYIFKY